MPEELDRSGGSNHGPDQRRLRPSGGYRTLHSFRVATIIYDGTVAFCNHFLDKRTRAVDQMVQAARSGRQNIAERQRQQQRPPAPEAPCPSCPLCGKPMVRRTTRKGVQTGSQFWGCTGYPECRGTRRLDEKAEPHRSDGRVGSVGSNES